MAAWTVGAESDGVVSTAEVGLVLGMSRDCSQFSDPVGKLTLLSVLAGAVLLERSTQLGLVAAGIDLARSRSA
jgi:hypothetical protein